MGSRREDQIARLTRNVERHRADYMRIRQAGSVVTPGEVDAARNTYTGALEGLSLALQAKGTLVMPERPPCFINRRLQENPRGFRTSKSPGESASS
jgi:hypothetical protein